MTLDDLAMKFQLEGYTITAGAISHWEHERHNPPMHDEKFRETIAKLLKLDIPTVLRLSGYELSESNHTDIWQQISSLVDKQPIDKQKQILRLIEAVIYEDDGGVGV